MKNEWRIESFRLTTFHKDPIELNNLTWWSDVAGKEPDVTQINRAEGSRTDIGAYGSNHLSLQVTAGKVDWQLQSGIDVDQPMRSIGSFAESLRLFPLSALKKVAPLGVIRLGVGVVAFAPVPDRVAGYKVLQPFLHSVSLDIENMSDFFYQINRPRQMALKSGVIKINRLMKWGVRRIAIRSANVVESSDEKELSRSGVDIDVNTDQENKLPFEPDDVESIFQKFGQLIDEILVDGDR